eukprot:851350-Amphidinium_carterae.1
MKRVACLSYALAAIHNCRHWQCATLTHVAYGPCPVNRPSSDRIPCHAKTRKLHKSTRDRPAPRTSRTIATGGPS